MAAPPDPSFLVGRDLIAFHVAARMIEFLFGARSDEDYRGNPVVTLMAGYSFKIESNDWVRREEAIFSDALMTLLDRPVVAAQIGEAWDLHLEMGGGCGLILHAEPPYESYVLGDVYVTGKA